MGRATADISLNPPLYFLHETYTGSFIRRSRIIVLLGTRKRFGLCSSLQVPLKEKPRPRLRNGKNLEVSQFLLWQISWVKEAGGRNIHDESCAPPSDWIIRQATRMTICSKQYIKEGRET